MHACCGARARQRNTTQCTRTVLSVFDRIAKNYKAMSQNRLFMKIDNLVAGLIVVAFGVILLADAILTTVDPASQLFSPNDVKGIVGMALVVLAAIYFKKAKE